jgi:hypothetical protein
MNLKRLSLLLAVFAILPEVGSAAPCRWIYSVTLPITQPGRYCFARDIATTNGSGLVIRSDNVIVDFLGRKLSTTPIPGSLNINTGVDAAENQNITILNGTIQGYIVGINLGERVPTNNLGNFLVNNMRIDQGNAPTFRVIGIFAEAANFTITNNIITNLSGAEAMGMLMHGTDSSIPTPGRIVITGNRIDRLTAGNGDNASGIVLDGGAETIVNDNVITEVYSGGPTPGPFDRAGGIQIANVVANSLTEVGGNTVRNNFFRPNTTGIYLNTTGDLVAFVRDSVVSGMNTGLLLGGACVPYYLYNTVTGATTPYSIVGSPIPCSRTSIDPGPGNR